MRQTVSHNEPVSSQMSATSSKNFIDDAIFEKLLAIREEVYKQTDINVSPRKLVHMLLQEANFEALRDKLIEKYV